MPTASSDRRTRRRGEIEELPSGSLRVRLYAGRDPLTKRRYHLQEVIPAGPRAREEAERTLRRFIVQVEEKRNPQTSATVSQLLDRHFELLEVDRTTLATYRTLADRHIRPLIGKIKVDVLRAQVFDSFYAELRRCRAHCKRRPFVEHRLRTVHDCDHRCRQHVCRPLSRATIRQIHVILSGALRRAVRWRWLATNPIEHAEPPKQPTPKPQPPSPAEAARILNAAWEDPDWAVLVWLTMVTGCRRGELCGLRWHDVDLVRATLRVERSVAQLGSETWEKDTKTHQQRRIALDPETVTLLTAHRQRCMETAATLGVELRYDAYIFSPTVDGTIHLKPRSVSKRYSRLAQRLGIQTTFHKLRHYSATELIAGGVDVRTVAGRLGHGGGGTTTLRVYAAWVSEADQRASSGLLDRLPRRPAGDPGTVGPDERFARNPYELAALDLREQILDGTLRAGSPIPTTAEIAERYGIAVGTANRTVALLRQWELIEVRSGLRPVVRQQQDALPEGAKEAAAAKPLPTACSERSGDDSELFELLLRHRGVEVSRAAAAVPALKAGPLRRLFLDAVARAGGSSDRIGEYEMEVRRLGTSESLMTFVSSA